MGDRANVVLKEKGGKMISKKKLKVYLIVSGKKLKPKSIKFSDSGESSTTIVTHFSKFKKEFRTAEFIASYDGVVFFKERFNIHSCKSDQLTVTHKTYFQFLGDR